MDTKDNDQDYPNELDHYVTLPNQRRLHVRALRRGETGAIHELYAHLSDRSRYLRFFSIVPTLPDPVVRVLACVDHRRRLAVVAEYENGRDVDVVGLANFGADERGNAELGLVVRDDWQRLGIGTELATSVLDAAEARGFHRFIAYVLPGNLPIRRIVKRLGEIVSSSFHGGVSELAFVRRGRRA